MTTRGACCVWLCGLAAACTSGGSDRSRDPGVDGTPDGGAHQDAATHGPGGGGGPRDGGGGSGGGTEDGSAGGGGGSTGGADGGSLDAGMYTLDWEFDRIIPQIAPPDSEFDVRGDATATFGNELQPALVLPDGSDYQNYDDTGFGRISYRDATDVTRSYDLYVLPSGTVWKIDRLGPSNARVEYLGSLHYSECPGGKKTPSDRMLMPALGLDLNHATEGGLMNASLRTNYGCETTTFGLPYPIDNYQGSASGRGYLSAPVSPPHWDAATRTAYFRTRPFPWMYYPEVLDPDSPEFKADFAAYGNRTLIQELFQKALDAVELDVAIRVLPDGTVLYAWRWSFLVDTTWGATSTEGLWTVFNGSKTSLAVYEEDPSTGWIEVTGPKSLAADSLARAAGWVGYFVDPVNANLGFAIHYGSEIPADSGISMSPRVDSALGPGVFATNTFPKTTGHKDGRILRQVFLSFGTREDLRATHARVDPYVRYQSR